MGITNIIFIIIYHEDYGIIYHSLPLRGSLNPQPIYYPTPSIHTSIQQQHHIFLNLKSL